MEQKQSWTEITQTFKDQWVELVDYDWDLTKPNPTSGRVLRHSANRAEFNQLILSDPADDSAIVFTGKINLPDNAYLHSNLRLAKK